MQVLRDDSGSEMPSTALTVSHQRVTRVSILDDQYNPIPGGVLTGVDGYAVSGSVQMDRSRSVERTVSLEIVNPQGVWTPNGPGSMLYWDRLLRVERGVKVGGQDFVAPLGVFLIDSPTVTRSGGNHTMSLTGSDRMDRATRSEFAEPVTYAAGTRVKDAIYDMLVYAGVGTERWSADDRGATLGAARSFEVGDECLQSALTLATSFALEVFADANGYIVIRPRPDPMGLPPMWTFEAGADATHIGISKKWSRDRFYNHILVTNDTSDTDIPMIRAEAEDTNPASPTRVNGPMGRRLYKYVSAMITTQGQADNVAASLLWEHALIEEEVSVEHVPLPVLEASDAIILRDTVSVTDDKYMINSLTVPLAEGSASLNVKKVRNLNA